jgi:nicotinate-nucleotide pyrophosphorylase
MTRTTIRQGIARIERRLRLFLARKQPRPGTRHVELPVCRRGGGTLHGVELDDSTALLDRMEGRPVS